MNTKVRAYVVSVTAAGSSFFTTGCGVATAPAPESGDTVSGRHRGRSVLHRRGTGRPSLRSLDSEHPNEDASASGGYRVVAGSPAGDVLGPSYARSELSAEAGQVGQPSATRAPAMAVSG